MPRRTAHLDGARDGRAAPADADLAQASAEFPDSDVLAKLRVQRAKDDVTRQRALTDFVAAAFANVATPREGGVSLNGYMRLLVEDAPAAK